MLAAKNQAKDPFFIAAAVVVSCIVMKGRRSDHCGGYELPKPGFWEWGF